MKKNKIALFDLDGTLFHGNSTFDFIEFIASNDPEYKAFIKRYTLLKLFNKIAFKLFRYDWYKKKSVNFLKGKNKSELESLSREFYKKELFSRRVVSVFEMLNYFQTKGYEIGIITATLDVIANEVAKNIKVDELFSTPLSYQNEIATGKFSKDLLHKKANIFYENIYNKYEHAIFVSDNKEDIPLLKSVNCGIYIYANF